MSYTPPYQLILTCLLLGPFQSVVADGNPVLVDGPQGQITAREVLVESARAPEEVRKRLLSAPNTVASTATNLYVRRVLAEKARQEGLQNDDKLAMNLRLLEERLLSDAYMAKVAQEAVPDDAALEKLAATEYRAYPERFLRPEQVHVRHILVSPPDDPVARQKAASLLAELRAGADFATLALKYSADNPSAGKGGDLGFILRGKTVPPFEAAAFGLTENGQLSEVVETQYGYHIIRLEERLDRSAQPFEEVKTQIKQSLASRFGRQALAEITQALSAEAKPNDEAIQALVSGSE